MRYVFGALIVFALAPLIGCGPPSPPAAGESGFDSANDQIGKDSGGSAFGNSDEAREMAKEFSERLADAEAELFTGGSEKKTGATFRTFCQVNDDKVAFLVHVPQFKEYKGEVRDALITIAWTLANDVIETQGLTGVERLGVGLRGSLLYGGLAIGPPYQDPETTENSFLVEKELLFEFFRTPEE